MFTNASRTARPGLTLGGGIVGLAALTGFVALAAPAYAQPAQGAPAAMERVREVMAGRAKDLKLPADPDQAFAAMLLARDEDLVFLAKTQLEYGGDRRMRELAQALSDEATKRIALAKEWQVRSREAGYRAQPDQPPPGSGPLDRAGANAGAAGGASAPAAAPPPPASPAASATAPPAAPAAALPKVAATVDDVNAGAGKITLDHAAIPNLGMDAMTMVFRAADPALLAKVKKGDRIRFTADRVNGQLTVTGIEKGR